MFYTPHAKLSDLTRKTRWLTDGKGLEKTLRHEHEKKVMHTKGEVYFQPKAMLSKRKAC